MPRCRPHVAAIAVLVLAIFAPLSGAGDEEDRADEALLRESGIGSDGASLVAFFRGRSLSGDDHQRLAGLIRDLGDDVFARRERASAALLRWGPLAVPFLKKALVNPDAEVIRRARACLEEIEHGPGPTLPAAAARLLVRSKPAGAAEALIGYAPFADDVTVADEVCSALESVGLREGKPVAAVFAALEDKEPARRAAAAFVVGRCAEAGLQLRAARLGRDPDPAVRFRAAQGLLAGRNREGLAILVGLLGDAPHEWADRADELLLRLAGEDAPQTDPAARPQWLAAWEGWRTEKGGRADLARLESAAPALGFTIVVEPDAGRVYEYDRAGKVRWQITGLARPHDAQALANGHILVSEYDARRVSERDLAGKTYWSYAVEDARYVERLGNGNTFIGTTVRAFEVSPAGKEVWNVAFDAGEGAHLGVHRRANGNVVTLSMAGQLREINRQGRTVHSSALPRGHWCGVHALANHHYLAAELNSGLVLEVDAAGKIVRECKVPSAVYATRQPDGRTFVCSYNGRRVVELDRAGQVVGEKAGSSNVWRTRSR
jgi:hypothetical protein